MAGRPAGAQNKDKPYRDALRRAIARAAENPDNPRNLDRIADQHLSEAASGDMGAIKELADRIDGKVPQGIGGSDELPPIETLELTDQEAARRLAHLLVKAERDKGKPKK